MDEMTCTIAEKINIVLAFVRYFFEIDGGKKIRPTMVLAVSYALNGQSKHFSTQNNGSDHTLAKLYANPSQKRLAEITEMIHTASLFHDDVIDKVRQLSL
jgi:geranylgeranyl pyrophosphate synthase